MVPHHIRPVIRDAFDKFVHDISEEKDFRIHPGTEWVALL